MIIVKGQATLKVDFELELNMSESAWDSLSEGKQNEIIDGHIGQTELDSAELDDCDVWDVIEVEGEDEENDLG